MRREVNIKGRTESYLSVREFCDLMNISSSTVYRMIKTNQIPVIKFGGRYKIPKSMFDKLNPRYIQW